MKAPVLNKNFASPRACHNYTCYINSGYIALQRLRIAHRPAFFCGQFDSQALQEVVVGMVSRQRENEVVFQTDLSMRSIYQDVVRPDFYNLALEVRANFSAADAIFD